MGTLWSGSGSGNESGNGSVNGSGEPIPRGPMDKFVISQSRQMNDPYWVPMVDAIANFGPGFKPPSMHELRTWILKEEVNDINIMMKEHKKAWKQYGCLIMLMEKMRKLWWTLCVVHCIDLMLEDVGKLNVHANTLLQARQVVNTWAKKVEGVKARSAILFDPNFWPHIAFCIKTTIPLVSVLREVDSEERPAMGYIYELMDSTKEKIAFNCGGMKRKYGPIWRKIDARWTPQLHRPLHAAGYYLNPQLRYEDKFSNVDEVRKGLFECMDRMLDYQERLKVDIQLDSYDQAMVLSLTCSVSGCERNWSSFESIHTKKRNRLEHKSLNALVYVRYNTRLKGRSLQRKQNVDPILVDEIDSNDEWIAEKEDPLLPLDLCWLKDNELFNVDVIRIVSSQNQETQASSDNMVSSHSNKRKHDEFASKNGGQGKGKELNLTPIHEDEELDELGGFDGGNFPTIDTLDEDDDDIGEDDLS
ncbi:hypothetical protein AAG906_018690 [Vitis piasezkii]